LEVGTKRKPVIDSLKLDLITALTMSEAFKEAQEIGLEQISDLNRRGDDQSLMIAMTQTAMARSYSSQLNHDEADRLLQQAQPILRSKLGETHARTLNLRGELLGIAFKRADWPSALVQSEQIYQAVAQKFGDDNFQTSLTKANWGKVLFESGNSEKAAQVVRAAYEQIKTNQSDKSPPAQDIAYALASIELQLGRLQPAEQLINTLEPAILESYRGHGLWAEAVNGLRGLLLHAKGQSAAAKPLLASSLEKLKPKTPDEPKDRIYRMMEEAYADGSK
jgi:eukaryotic-like serine/threonine-protein kinase